MTQNQFAEAYGIPLATLKGWEQGRRHSDAAAASYLSVIAELPRETMAALDHSRDIILNCANNPPKRGS